MLFFRDSTDESGVGMIPPASWVLQYVDLATGSGADVETDDAYGRSSDALNEVAFAAVTTTKLRAVMQAWGTAEAGGSSGILEFEAWAAEVEVPDVTAPTVTLQAETEPGAGGWYRDPVRLVRPGRTTAIRRRSWRCASTTGTGRPMPNRWWC